MISYTVKKGGYLNRFLCSEVQEKPFHAQMTPTVFPDYHPGCGTKDGKGKERVSPAKREYIEKGEFLTSPYPDDVAMDNLYWPLETEQVDFSGMWVYPCGLTFYSRVYINAGKASEAVLTLSVSGAAKVWVNRKEVLSFAPYEANTAKSRNFSADLEEGMNELVVGVNDYGERNIMLRFSLRNEGEPLDCSLPSDADVSHFPSDAAALNSLYLDKLSYKKGEAVLIKASDPLPAEFHFTASGKDLTLGKGETGTLWGDTSCFEAGAQEMRLSFTSGGIGLSRSVPFEVYEEASGGVDRKISFLEYYQNRKTVDTEVIISRLSAGLALTDLSPLLSDLAKLEKRADCADFRLLRFLWIYLEYKDGLEESLQKRIRDAIISFRYWFDEKGNDAMWFFSENHALAFHTDEYISGMSFPETVFPNSGLTGREHAGKARGLLREWFDKLFTYGYNEWNSTNYIPVDIVSYLTLYKLAPEFRATAKKALDLTFSLFSDISFKGVLNGSSGRAYNKDLLNPWTHQTNALSYILWGKGAMVPSASAVFLSLTDYEAPPELEENAMCSFSGIRTAERLQGTAGVRTTAVKCSDYILSTSSSPREGMAGSQEVLINAMLSDPSCRFFINHPGERRVWGTRRPGYFNGNGLTPKVTQRAQSALLSYRFDSFRSFAEVDYTHLVTDFTAYDEVIRGRKSVILRKGGAFAFIYSDNGLDDAKDKSLSSLELVSPGLDDFWYVRLSSSSEISFPRFVSKMESLEIKVKEEEVVIRDFSMGDVVFPLLPKLRYYSPIGKGDWLKAAVISPVKAVEWHGEAEAYPEKVYVTPQRLRYIKDGKFPEMEGKADRFMFPLEGNRIDLSGFYMRPSVVSFSSELFLRSPSACAYPFTLVTENAARVYLNGEEVFSEETLERNKPRSLGFQISLSQGWNRVVLFFHDYAERDTRLGYSLRYDGSRPLEAGLSMACSESELRLLASLSLPAFSFSQKDDVVLTGLAPEPVECAVSLCFSDSHVPYPPEEKKAVFNGKSSVPLSDLINREVGLMDIKVRTPSGLERVFQAEYASSKTNPPVLGTVRERKQAVLRFTAENGVENFQKILAMNAAGRSDWRDIFCKEMDRLEHHYDCSDFRVPAVLYALCRQRECFSDEEVARMEAFLLSFRYWWDEKGNDVMWFFSENHAICFFVSAFIAGKLFPDKVFSCSSLTGREAALKAKERIKLWMEDFRKNGFREWNSSVYIPIDVIALTALYELSGDDELTDLAKYALDRTFGILAVNSYKGVMAGSAGRMYFRSLTGRRINEASTLDYIAFGEGFLNQHTFSTVLMSLSSYEPPEELHGYAFPEEPVLFTGQRRLKVYKSPSVILASALNPVAGIRGYQEVMAQCMVGDIDTAIWINHPGEAALFGQGRPGYFAGNGTVPKVNQVGAQVFMEFSIPEDQLPFTHAFVPLMRFEAYKVSQQHAYLMKDGVFVHIFAQNGLEVTEKGPFRYSELVSKGRKNVWTVKVDDRHPEWSLDQFIDVEEGPSVPDNDKEILLKEVSYE